MEPAKTVRLVKIGYKGEKPMLVKYKPKDIPKNKKAAQMGSVKGTAALKAVRYLFISFTVVILDGFKKKQA